jgi:hypothetical protein
VHAATPGTLPLRQSAANGAEVERQPRNAPSLSASSVLLSSAQAGPMIFGCSERQFHKLRNEPWFTAKPRMLGPRTTRWVRAELEALVLNMPAAQTKQPEPPSLLRGKIEKLKRGGSASAPETTSAAETRPKKPAPALAAVPA